MRPSTDRPLEAARPLPFDESIGVFFQGRVIPDFSQRYVYLVGARIVLGRASGNRAGFDAWLDAAVIAQPADALIGNFAPEAIVQPFQRMHHERAEWFRRAAQGLHGERAPPRVGFRVRTHRRARQADLPVLSDERTQLVARLPFDLVLLDAVEDLLIGIEADAVGGTRFGALATDLAEVLHTQVDRLIWLER